MTTENTTKAAWERGGPSPNPGGRPRKDDETRAGEEWLRDKTLATAKRLVLLTESADEKIALGACIAHLKLVIKDAYRGRDDEESPYEGCTTEELKALARAQMAKEKAH